MQRIVAVLLVMTMPAAPGTATAQDRDLPASAERLAAAAAPTPDASGGNRWTGRMATGLALVGAGLVMVLAGNPDYVPSRFAPGNTPRRVDLGM